MARLLLTIGLLAIASSLGLRLLAIVAEQQSTRSVLMANWGPLAALGAGVCLIASICANLNPSSNWLNRKSRRRMLGLFVAIDAGLVALLLSPNASTSGWEGLLGAPAMDALRTNLEALPRDLIAVAEAASAVLFGLGCLLLISGSIRWVVVCILGLAALAYVALGLKEASIAGWLLLAFGACWLACIGYICPHCGAPHYRRVSSRFLGSRDVTVLERVTNTTQFVQYDRSGRYQGWVAGSGTQHVPVQRTQSFFAVRRRCGKCGYVSTSEESMVH